MAESKFDWFLEDIAGSMKEVEFFLKREIGENELEVLNLKVKEFYGTGSSVNLYLESPYFIDLFYHLLRSFNRYSFTKKAASKEDVERFFSNRGIGYEVNSAYVEILYRIFSSLKLSQVHLEALYHDSDIGENFEDFFTIRNERFEVQYKKEQIGELIDDLTYEGKLTPKELLGIFKENNRPRT